MKLIEVDDGSVICPKCGTLYPASVRVCVKWSCQKGAK